MNQLRSPIVWRLLLWVLLLTLVVPIGAVMVFARSDIRNFFTQQDQANLEERARILLSEINTRPDESQQIVETFGNKNTNAFILDRNGIYLAHTDPQKAGTPAISDLGDNVLQQILNTQSANIDGSRIAKLITVAGKLPGDNILVVTLDNTDRVGVLDTLTNKLIQQLVISLAIASLIGGGVSIATLLNPLIKLARLANDIGSGNYDTGINVEDYEGELAILATNLKDLSSNVKNSLAQLETRVVLRTKDLERRSIQLQTVAELGNAITSLRDLDAMLAQATLLISQRFGYYHAGIFLLDEYGEYAVLKSANSEGGRKMLERGHRLKVGETGIVGFVTKTRRARIALDVGQDAVYFDNPDLPETRSEIALPIIAGGQILGALDVQSTEAQAFSEEDSRTLQVLADQLAVAIQNARLFEQSESALEAAGHAYAESSRAAWQKHIRSEEEIGYIATPGSLQSISSQWNDDLINTVETGKIKIDDYEHVVNIPVKVRGQAIGAIRLRKQEASGSWTKEETALAIAFSDQLSSALESARIYRDAQQRAARGSIASDISSRITASPYTENVLRDTVMELGQAIGNVSVTFQLLQTSGGQGQVESSGNGNGENSASRKNGKKKE